MEFKKEPFYDITVDEDGTVVFYKKNELYSTVFYLGQTSMMLCRADMKYLIIPLTHSERMGLTSPSIAKQFAINYINKNKPEWI